MKKKYLIIGLVFVIIIVVGIICFIFSKKDVPDYPVFMFDDQMYLVTCESISNDGELHSLGIIDESVSSYDLNKNNQGFRVPEGSEVYQISDIESYDDPLMGTLAIKISENTQFGINTYNEGSYYIARKIIKRG